MGNFHTFLREEDGSSFKDSLILGSSRYPEAAEVDLRNSVF
jgi:hypothetical protein